MNIEQVWSEYRSSIEAFLHSKVSDAAEVDDLLQEVLIKTHEKLKTVEDEASIKAWLFRVTNNTIIDFYRKRARIRNIDTNDLWYAQDEESVQEELSRCVEPFVQALPEDAARLLTAIDLEGRSQRDYADDLGISYSTLKSRVQKSRSQLRGLFDQCCQFTLDQSGNLVEYDLKSEVCKDC